MNHALKTGQRGSTRDIGLEPSMHSTAGKGDASRISNLARFKNQLDQVALPRIPCAEDSTFTRTKRGFKKVYGTPATKPDVCEIAPPCPAVPYPPATKPDVIEFSVPPLSVVISPNEVAPELLQVFTISALKKVPSNPQA